MPAQRLDAILRDKSIALPPSVLEWYLLAGNWDQRGLNVWIPQQSFTVTNGTLAVLTDREGINRWGVRIGESEIDDPPVVCLNYSSVEVAFPSFSNFVAAMIVNDAIFGDVTEDFIELDHETVRQELTCFVASNVGDFFSNGPFESATVVAFAYPGGSPTYGKSRTPAGRSLLLQLGGSLP